MSMAGIPIGGRVGLLGGSFNPAHEGHLAISKIALQRLELDRVWWLVSPQNPLKTTEDMQPIDQRLALARDQARDPRIWVTDLERQLGTRFTVDTVARVCRRWPRLRFVWLMGADNLAQMDRWRSWRRIFEMVPVAVFARPTYSLRSLGATAAHRFADYRVAPERARHLADMKPPAWVFFQSRLMDVSATAIRCRIASLQSSVNAQP